MNKEPRLQFTVEERADPVLGKAVRRAEKAAAKADRAQAKIPKKRVKTKETVTDPATGKTSKRLKFEELDKKPPSKLTHAARDAPAGMALGAVHRQIHEVEEDNVGVESAHKSEQAVETGVRLIQDGIYSHKLKPYRQAARAERQLEKANIQALYQKALQENPQLASNPLSRWQQKQAIKRQYAAAKRTAKTGKTAKNASDKAGKATRAAAEKAEQAANFVWQTPAWLCVCRCAGYCWLPFCSIPCPPAP